MSKSFYYYNPVLEILQIFYEIRYNLCMKYMIASDIHGSAKYCQIMLERFATENADRLLLLGDLLYHGPRNELPEEYEPKKVISLLDSFHRVKFLRLYALHGRGGIVGEGLFLPVTVALLGGAIGA